MSQLDNVLIQKLKIKDPSSYITLVDTYGNKLLRLAYVITGDQQMAEDVLQESFLALYQNIESFREESTLSTWLTRITINKAKNLMRSKSYRKIFLVEKEMAAVDYRSLPDQRLEIKENRKKVREILLSLPIKYRDVLYLYYYEEMKIKEIADVLDVGESTIKSRLKRGKEKLKRLFEKGERGNEE